MERDRYVKHTLVLWVQTPLLQVQSSACSPPAGSQPCDGRGQEQGRGVAPGMWGSEHPCATQGQEQQGEKALGKTRGKPGALTMSQPRHACPPPPPAPHWGCRGLPLPARSHLITLTKLGRAESLVPSPMPDPAGRPSFSELFFWVRTKEEEGAAQCSYPNCVAVLWGPIKLLAAGIEPRIH